MNEELEYVLETIRFKTSIYRDKKKRNLSFNDDDYYSNILNEYITDLQQENTRLKDKIEKAIEYIKNIDKFEERLNDDTRIYMIQDVDIDEIERILKEN